MGQEQSTTTQNNRGQNIQVVGLKTIVIFQLIEVYLSSVEPNEKHLMNVLR